MREFELIFSEGLKRGLRQEEFSPAVEQRLVECRNLRPRANGLLPLVTITNPFAAVVAWPFPQVLVGRNYKLLATSTQIYTCSALWAVTLVLDSITAGACCWDWADFGDYLLMTNGSKMVKRTGDGGVWSSFTSSGAVPGMKTVCNFRGQAVGGNITTTWHDCGPNYIVWSDIGSTSFDPGLKNEAGYTMMPFSGAVLRVLPLGDAVIVYGENGIVVLKPAQQYFAMAELLPVGIPSKGAVGGGDRGHVFIDYNGELWKLGPDLKPQKLGYQEYMTLMDASKIMVSYNGGEDEYYVSDGVYGYLLTPWGLCQTYQLVTSIAFVDGQLVGVTGSDGVTTRQLVTDVVDFGIRSFKTVTALEFGVYGASAVYGAVDWRSNIAGTFTRSTWLTTNPTGFITPIVTANDFRLCIKSAGDIELRYIIARVKNVDRRAMRGVLVTGPGSRRRLEAPIGAA
jgi:hypothetical protein